MDHSSVTDRTRMQDPTTQYPRPPFEKQPQSPPGLARDMKPKPDHGEDSYAGTEKLKGRRALITGADSGIGRAVAIAFAREGADVFLSYLPAEQADADEVIAIAKDAGVHVHALPGDLTDESFCERLVGQAREKLGGLDLVVNVAGRQIYHESLQDLSTEDLEATFRTNVFAMYWICKTAIPHLPPGSSIINTASIQSYDPSAMLMDYAPTKAAIVAFTKLLAQQLGAKGIRVNAVAPGPIWTPLNPSHGQPQEKVEKFGSSTPLGRPGQPVEVSPAYVFLATQEASFVTGEVYGVTGGHSAS